MSPYQSGMANPYASMLREEDERLKNLGVTPEQQAQAAKIAELRAQGLLPSSDAYSQAQGSQLASAERGVDQQMKYASALRDTAMPTVKQYGNVAAPNVYDQAAAGIKRLTGAYMGKKANEADAALDPQRAAQAAAQAEIDQAKALREVAVEQAGIRQGDEGLGLQRAKLAQQGEQFGQQMAATLSSEQADREFKLNMASADADLARELAATNNDADKAAILAKAAQDQQLQAQKQQDLIDRGWKVETFYKDGKLGSYAVNDNGEIREGNSRGPVLDYKEASDLIGYTAGQEGSTKDAGNAALKKLHRAALVDGVKMDNQRQNATKNLTDIMANPKLDKFTGALSLPRFAAQMGIGDEAWIGQAIDQKIRLTAIDYIAELADIFKPMSDVDLKEIKAIFPQSINEPEAILTFLNGGGRQYIKELYDTSRAQYVQAEDADAVAALDAQWGNMDKALTRAAYDGAVNLGVKPSDAQQMGLDPEFLERAYQLRKKDEE